MTDQFPLRGSPETEVDIVSGLTDAEKLAALETYIKVLKPVADALRVKVTANMGAMHAERVGAFLPDGTKLAAVTHSDGRKGVKVTDDDALLKWCLDRHPDEVTTVTVQAVRPAYLKVLLDDAKSNGGGVDRLTGEVLPFIEVTTGTPYVSVLTTDEGVERMSALANGFVAMIEGGN